MHGSWHAPFFSTRAKPSYTNGYHHKEGGTVGGTVTVPKTEPLFSLNKGSISPKQSLCFTEIKALSVQILHRRPYPPTASNAILPTGNIALYLHRIQQRV